MAKKETDKKIIDLPVAKLKPHPLQKQIYGERPDWQIQELADHMARNGQDEPVEVTPGLDIISGHGRVEAAKRLGWTTVRCWVRHDLAEAGSHAVEARLIEANLVRRQLSKLDMARSYLHLKKMARDKRGNLPREDKVKGDLRDLLAKRYGKCGRSLDRLARVLELPLPLQQAVDEGRLALTLAVKVAGLDDRDRARIAERVRAGEDPAALVQAYLPKPDKRHKKVADALAGFVRGLRRGLEDLDGRLEGVRSAHVKRHLADLENARDVIEELIGRAKGKE